MSRDVTELRCLQQNLADLAMRDPLTGLANRRLLVELLDAELARTRDDDLPVAIAYIDLDGLKQVNDTHGHDGGDNVLRETANRLVSLVRGADVVARVGGDEFVILYEPGNDDSHALVERIDRSLSEPIRLTDTISVRCSASVGTADTRLVGRNPATLLAAADHAMYRVKRARHANQVA